jgi:hypothetical protein
VDHLDGAGGIEESLPRGPEELPAEEDQRRADPFPRRHERVGDGRRKRVERIDLRVTREPKQLRQTRVDGAFDLGEETVEGV